MVSIRGSRVVMRPSPSEGSEWAQGPGPVVPGRVPVKPNGYSSGKAIYFAMPIELVIQKDKYRNQQASTFSSSARLGCGQALLSGSSVSRLPAAQSSAGAERAGLLIS